MSIKRRKTIGKRPTRAELQHRAPQLPRAGRLERLRKALEQRRPSEPRGEER